MTNEKLDAIKAALAKVGVLPIDPNWTYTVIRHRQRNMEVNVADGFNEPNRQGGTFMAEIVNAAPDLIATIRTLNAALAAMTAERDALRALLADTANELASELDNRYAGLLYHPAMKKDYDNDMSTVVVARAALNPNPS